MEDAEILRLFWDREKQAAGHFYVSWGADREEILPMSSVNFRQEGTSYLLFGFLDLSADEMFRMAGEILALA